MLSSTLLFMSAPDITIILVVAVIFFGGKKLPELARGLGQGIKEFKDATNGDKPADAQPPVQQAPPPPAPPVYQAPPAQPPVQQAPPVEHRSDLPDYTPVNQTHPPAQQ